MARLCTPALGEGAFIFDGPDFKYNKLTTIYAGELVEVINIDRYPWYQVRYKDIKGWMPSVSLDFVLPDAPMQVEFKLVWPTDYYIVTQGFGLNPGFYSTFGLPGHEGVDLKAPNFTNIYSGAKGRVSLVHDGSNNHPYGIHVRIVHDDGYQTIYAHLTRATVKAGDDVKAKQIIGLADSTGNSTGPHLHLTLKLKGATALGLTKFPNDIIDPTPYLIFA